MLEHFLPYNFELRLQRECNGTTWYNKANGTTWYNKANKSTRVKCNNGNVHFFNPIFGLKEFVFGGGGGGGGGNWKGPLP